MTKGNFDTNIHSINSNETQDLMSILKYIGLALALFFPSCYMISMVGYFFGVSILQFSFICALLISFTFLFYKLPWKIAVLTSLIVVALFIGAGSFSGNFYDQGWDSTYFHQIQIMSLNNGLNPVDYEIGILVPEIEALDIPDEFTHQMVYNNPITRTYAKSLYVIWAAYSSVFGDLEEAKGISFIFLFIVFALFSNLYTKCFVSLSKIEVLIFGILTALSPVVIALSLSFYMDYVLYASLCIVIALFSLYIVENKKEYLYLGLLFSIFFINIKHSAILFFCIFIAFYVLYILLYKRENFSSLIKVLILFSIVALVFSWCPYVQNTLEYGHPGGNIQNAYNSLAANTNVWSGSGEGIPVDWMGKSNFEKFIHSAFSGPGGDVKYPFVFQRVEDFIGYDSPSHFGGWGPLFSEILVLSFALFLYSIFQIIRTKKTVPLFPYYLFIILSLVATFQIFDLSWYSRYVPQAWLLPLLMILPYATTHSRIIDYGRYFVLILCIINSAVVGGIHLNSQGDFSQNYATSLDIIYESGNTAFITAQSSYETPIFLYSYLYKLTEQGSTVIFTDEVSDQHRSVWKKSTDGKNTDYEVWIIPETPNFETSERSRSFVRDILTMNIYFEKLRNDPRTLMHGWHSKAYGGSWMSDESFMFIENKKNASQLSFSANSYKQPQTLLVYQDDELLLSTTVTPDRATYSAQINGNEGVYLHMVTPDGCVHVQDGEGECLSIYVTNVRLT